MTELAEVLIRSLRPRDADQVLEVFPPIVRSEILESILADEIQPERRQPWEQRQRATSRRLRWGRVLAVTAAAAAVVIGVVVTTSRKPASAEQIATRTIAAVGKADLNLMRSEKVTVTSGVPRSILNTELRWSYGKSVRVEFLAADGVPITDVATPRIGSDSGEVVVDYARRAWYLASQPSYGAGFSASQVVTLLKTALRTGQARVVSQAAVVAGRTTIELSVVDRPEGETTIWVTSATYLPLQVVSRLNGETQTSKIEWLQPSVANLSKLSAPIPSSFTKLSGPPPGAPR